MFKNVFRTVSLYGRNKPTFTFKNKMSVINTEVKEQMRIRWDVVNTETDKNKSEKWWKTITEYYGQPQRYYHTLHHLWEMTQHFDWCEKQVKFKNPKLVILAIFFHDIVYDPTKGDNEEKSADLFEDYVKDIGTVTPEDYALVKDWIILTKTHEAGVSDKTDDGYYFLDIDMAVLGRQTENYDKYASQIRQEYIHIPIDIYRQKRAEILEDFGKRLPLYSTQLFRDKLEDQAKDNLKREIERLRDTSIPL